MFVRDLTANFGANAGKIWRSLNEKGSLGKEKLLEITQLKDSEFYTGVGWLARENKIFNEDGDCYRLDTSNLTSKIGANAGRVWKIMDIWGEVDVSTIRRLADIDEKEVYFALGWLARENKICVDKNLRYNLK